MPNAIILHNPLTLTDRRRIEIAPGLTVGQVCALAEIREALAGDNMVVSLGGRIIREREYGSTVLRADDFILFMPAAANDETTRTIGMIALMAAAPGLGNLALGAKWGAAATLGSSIASAAIVVGGGLLINSFGSRPGKAARLGPDPEERSQAFGWSPLTVQRPGVPRPRVYGRVRTHGVLVEAYNVETSSASNELYQHALVVLGDGPFDEPVIPGTELVNSQPITNYTADSIDRFVRFGDLAQYAFEDHAKSRCQTRPFIHVTNAGGAKEHQTYGDTFDDLVVTLSFPGGLYDGSGASIANNTVNVTVEVRKIKIGRAHV